MRDIFSGSRIMVGSLVGFAILGLLTALYISDARGVSEADKTAQIGALMGILQFTAALVTLWAAYKIAADQAARTEAVETKRRDDFIASIEALGDEALGFVAKAADEDGRWQMPNLGLQDVISRLREYSLALNALMGVAPPEAKLILAASRLAISTKRADNAGVDGPTGRAIVLQFRDDIRKALGEFKDAGKPLTRIAGS